MLNKVCLTCRGNMKCGEKFCPIYSKRSIFIINPLKGDEFFGATPPGVFVGSRLQYPNMNIGILSLPFENSNEEKSAAFIESPRTWAETNIGIEPLFRTRASLINSRFQARAIDARSSSSSGMSNKFIEISQLIAMSSRPVDAEIALARKINFTPGFDKIAMPMGPRAGLKKIRLTENPKIPTYVDKVVTDNELKATEALCNLHSRGYEEAVLSKLLSIGTLGLAKNRRFVSTRWAITAVDDTIGKSLISKIKDNGTIDKYEFYYGYFFGNHYWVLLMPRQWSYELFEAFMPDSVWNFTGNIEISTDYETYAGRKTYAEHCVGGYYAARLPVLEHLFRRRKQASVFVFRVETPEYKYPMGVWVCRETTRKAMQSKPGIFEDLDSALDYFRNRTMQTIHFDLDEIFKKSNLIREVRVQRPLNSFF